MFTEMDIEVIHAASLEASRPLTMMKSLELGKLVDLPDKISLARIIKK